MRLETFFSISEQSRLFLLSVVLGVFLGVLFDCFRVIRIVLPPARRAGAVCLLDIIFLLCFGAAIFLYSAALGRGQVRFFYFLGSSVGFILYIVSIGNIVTSAVRFAVNIAYKALQRVYYIIIEPFVKIIGFFRQKGIGFFVRNHKVDDNLDIS
ncbi:MAG: spore cortex biosynthesis protein YabQ [Oscillospiraceae bacterium]|nr:spore cortex biosynthesis protein YabQ [Oscillospiraceae bacterium]